MKVTADIKLTVSDIITALQLAGFISCETLEKQEMYILAPNMEVQVLDEIVLSLKYKR
jgi:hypothetical protein